MYQRPPHGDLAYFRAARRLLQGLHRRGVAHNDLAKEANWLVLADGRPALIDFQLAVLGKPRSRWMRLLAREDLRHLLKHKRTYCPQSITPRSEEHTSELQTLTRNSYAVFGLKKKNKNLLHILNKYIDKASKIKSHFTKVPLLEHNHNDSKPQNKQHIGEYNI